MRSAARLRAVQPAEPIGEPERAVTITELMELRRMSRSLIERLVSDGLPAFDVGRHHPGRRPKRSLRFLLSAVDGWLAARTRR